jgi:KDO2-lipid IV(A) lauroyltransferase
MTYAALCVLAAVVGRLPHAVRDRLGVGVGWFAGSVLRIRRSLVEAAMARAGVREPATIAARMYRDLGRGVFELLWLAGTSPNARATAVSRVTLEEDAVRTLDDAVARGPVILFASHTGNWELAAAAAAQRLGARGKRLAVVAKAMHARGVDAFLARLRERFSIRVVPPRGALTSTRQALAAGDVVVMPIDQVPDRAAHGVPVRFLQQDALADRAPATLAWRARATVLVVAAERGGDGHRVRVLDMISPPSLDAATNARDWIRETTARATSALEAFVERSPEAWLWLHRRWRSPRSRTHGGSGKVAALHRRASIPPSFPLKAPRPLVAPRQAG